MFNELQIQKTAAAAAGGSDSVEVPTYVAFEKKKLTLAFPKPATVIFNSGQLISD